MDDGIAHVNQQTYDAIAAQYADVRGETTWNSDLVDLFVSSLAPGSVIADLGCGPGVECEYFAGLGHNVVGIDISFEMLRIARSRIGRRVAQADWLHLPLRTSSLSGLWSSASLLHIPHEATRSAAHEVSRVLTPGGILALITAEGTESGSELEPVSYAEDERRWYFYRKSETLITELESCGLRVKHRSVRHETRDWVEILAVRDVI